MTIIAITIIIAKRISESLVGTPEVMLDVVELTLVSVYEPKVKGPEPKLPVMYILPRASQVMPNVTPVPVPPVLFAHNTLPEGSYLARKTFEPPVLTRVNEPIANDGEVKFPVK